MDFDKMTPAEREELRKKRQAEAEAEIGQMDDIIFGSSSTPAEEPVVEPEPVQAVEPEPEPESVIEPEPVQVSPEVAPVEDEYDFSFINEMARDAIARMTGQPQAPAPEPPTPSAQTPTPAPTPVAAPPQPIVPPGQLVSLEEMQAAFDSPEKMVELMGKVYAKAKQDAIQEAAQQASQATIQVTEAAERQRTFYEANPELKPYHDFVRYCAIQVERKHPDWNYDQVVKEVVKVAKEQLPRIRQPKSGPALPGSGGGSNRRGAPTPKATSLEAEIASMPDRF